MRKTFLWGIEIQLAVCFWLTLSIEVDAQQIIKSMLKFPDTGQNGDYTSVFGEDADYQINPPAFTILKNNIVLDFNTGLMWAQSDRGEITMENAVIYADTLTLGGFEDWRLPTAIEAYSILNHQKLNPALDISIFTKSNAEYWWTNEYQANDKNKVWCTNAGSGIGNHPKSETISAGGSKRFHARAVRSTNLPLVLSSRFIDNEDGTVTDQLTNLTWQQSHSKDSMSWDNAIKYVENLSLSGKNDWRLPNIKELQSITDYQFVGPSISTELFRSIGITKLWSSTTLSNQQQRAWYLHTQFGITTYENKTAAFYVLAVRSNTDLPTTSTQEMIKGKNIIVFPNPANQKITILFPNQVKNIRLILNSVVGQTLFEAFQNYIPTNTLELNLPRLPVGLYLLTIESGDNNYYKKIQIQP